MSRFWRGAEPHLHGPNCLRRVAIPAPADIIPVPSGSGTTEGYLVVRRRDGLLPQLPAPEQQQCQLAHLAAGQPTQPAAAAAWTAEREQRYLQQVQAVRLLVAVRSTLLQQQAARQAAQQVAAVQAAAAQAAAACAGPVGDSLATSTLLAAVASVATAAALPQQTALVPEGTAVPQPPEPPPWPAHSAAAALQLHQAGQLLQGSGQQRPPLWKPRPVKRPRQL